MITTDKHFEMFVKECKHWIDYWAMKQWRIEFRHGDFVEDTRANFEYHWASMSAYIALEEYWEGCVEVTDREIAEVAFHEVAEIMLSPIAQVASDHCNEFDYNQKVHSIIRRMENSIFKEYWDGREIMKTNKSIVNETEELLPVDFVGPENVVDESGVDVAVEIDITDDTFLKISKVAHEKDITFNQCVNELLIDYIHSNEDEILEGPWPDEDVDADVKDGIIQDLDD